MSIIIEPKPIVYFASPLLHEDERIMQGRYLDMVYAMAHANDEQDKIIPFSPIVNTYQVGKEMKNKNHDWYTDDLHYLQRFDGMGIVQLDGWQESKGIKIELDYCKKNNIPFSFGYYSLGNPSKIVELCEVLHLMIQESARWKNRKQIYAKSQ